MSLVMLCCVCLTRDEIRSKDVGKNCTLMELSGMRTDDVGCFVC